MKRYVNMHTQFICEADSIFSLYEAILLGDQVFAYFYSLWYII